jgi:hypothetical protein
MRCNKVQIKEVASLFSASASPAQPAVLFYGSKEIAEGELVIGTPFKLQVSLNEVRPINVPAASNPTPPVWEPGGREAYLETDDGIYRLDIHTGETVLFLKGVSEGLALSPDGRLIAFWRVAKNNRILTVYDVRAKTEVKSWPIPYNFEGEPSGYEVVFSGDGKTIFARTFDRPTQISLKSFSLRSGKVALIDPNCYGAARGSDGIYFISVAKDANKRSLRKIGSAEANSKEVISEFPYDSLNSSANFRWISAQDFRTHNFGVFDSGNGSLKRIGKFDAGTVLQSGEFIGTRGSMIIESPDSCTE